MHSRSMMSLEQTACEDLKAFERRLTEVVTSLQPVTYRWRVILMVISICTALGAWRWLADPVTYQVTFLQSLLNHPFFAISSLILFGLFLAGIHKRVVAPSIITSRVRQVLQDFNMSCDNVRTVFCEHLGCSFSLGSERLPLALIINHLSINCSQLTEWKADFKTEANNDLISIIFNIKNLTCTS